MLYYRVFLIINGICSVSLKPITEIMSFSDSTVIKPSLEKSLLSIVVICLVCMAFNPKKSKLISFGSLGLCCKVAQPKQLIFTWDHCWSPVRAVWRDLCSSNRRHIWIWYKFCQFQLLVPFNGKKTERV